MRHSHLGLTGLVVSAVGIGGGPLGGMPDLYGHDVTESQAVDAVLRVFDSEINFLDTSNAYANGESERRIGKAIQQARGLPAGFLLATKVDAADRTADSGAAPGSSKFRDFSGDRVRQSVRESVARLGIDHFPLLYLHDPEFFAYEDITGAGGALEALVELREAGVVDHLGLAGGDVAEMAKYLETAEFDVLLNHNRYTLVDQSAAPLLEQCSRQEIAFVNAAPFGGGLLARGTPEPGRVGPVTYGYQPASDQILGRVTAMLDVCGRHGVALAAAALQFSLNEPRIASTVVGVSRAERVDELLELASMELSDEFWDEILSL